MIPARPAAALALALAASVAARQRDDVQRAREKDAVARTNALLEARVGAGEPGAAVLVRRKGRTLLAHGRGVREQRTREPIDARTAFRLASLTKAFTAAAVELLVRDGRLRYDQPLTDVLAFPAYGRRVTIGHLLTHTSGLPDYEGLMETAAHAGGPPWSAERQIRDDEVLALLRAETSGLFAPGTRFSYSNSGYVVLGLVVARVAGKPFGDVLRERIFARLGMDDTLAYERGRNEVRRRAYGHAREAGSFREADQSPTSATLGDGGVYSTLDDLARWDDALRENTLVSPAAMKPALTPVRLADGSVPRWPPGTAGGDNLAPGAEVAYGFGWLLDPWRGRPRMWHQGETSGFRNAIHRLTDDGLTVVVLSNRDDLDAVALALEVAELFLDTRKDD